MRVYLTLDRAVVDLLTAGAEEVGRTEADGAPGDRLLTGPGLDNVLLTEVSRSDHQALVCLLSAPSSSLAWPPPRLDLRREELLYVGTELSAGLGHALGRRWRHHSRTLHQVLSLSLCLGSLSLSLGSLSLLELLELLYLRDL